MSKQTLGRRLGVAAGVAAAYFVAGKVGLAMALINPSASAVWPATGIALAATIMLGRGVWPAIWIGAFLVNLTTAGTPLTSAGVATGNTLEALLGAWLVERFGAGRRSFAQPADVVRFGLLAGVPATMVSATIGVTSLALGGFVAWPQYAATWLTWWLGDAAGALVVTPVVVLWRVSPRPAWSARQALELVAMVLATIAVSMLVFNDWPTRHAGFPLKFLTFPVLIWAAFRFGAREAASVVLVITATATWMSLVLAAPAEAGSSNLSLVVLQAFMSVASVTTLALSAAVAERRRLHDWTQRINDALEQGIVERTWQLWTTSQDLRVVARERETAVEDLGRSESRLREAQREARIGSWEWTIADNMLWWSDEMYEIYGLDPATFEASFDAFLGRVHADDRDRVRAAVERAIQDREPFTFDERIVRPDGAVLTLQSRGRVIVGADGRPERMLGTCLDVTDRQRAEDERAELIREQSARREAERSSRLKDEFLAVLSHEMRNPLNAVVGWARVLRDDTLDDATRDRAVRAIQRNAWIQRQLILDLLDQTRLTAEQLDLRRRVIDLVAVIEDALDTMGPEARDKGVTLEARLPSERVLVEGDPERLQQVVWNLLSNAIRFTPASGRVALSMTAAPRIARVRVEDDGPGFDAGTLERLIEGTRAGDAARREAGRGLGLTLVGRLIDLHGGVVRATNRDGGGAAIEFDVPLAAVAGDAERVPAPEARPARPAERRLDGLRVLLVEDNADSRETLALLLARRGADVRTAEDWSEALASFEREVPDVLVSDIALPQVDGYELLARMRALPAGGALPAIAVTAYAAPEHARRAAASGYQLHITKPYDVDVLAAAIVDLASRATAAPAEGPAPAADAAGAPSATA